MLLYKFKKFLSIPKVFYKSSDIKIKRIKNGIKGGEKKK